MTERRHVFLSYHRADGSAVAEVAERLRRQGVEPWLDTWNLVPGEAWQPAIEEALGRSHVCLVFVGPSGIGPWQHEEMRVAIDRRVTQREFRVIPVLLPGAERGRRSVVPPFLANVTWVEFPRTLDDEAGFHRLVSGIRGVPPGPGPSVPAVEGICPYRGLAAFGVADQPFFFGRAALTEWLVSDLRPAPGARPDRRFLAVVGASGSGKSSLARAGLLAALERGALPGSANWPQVVLRPGSSPLESLAVAAADALGLIQDRRGVTGFIEDLARDPRTLHLQVGLALRHGPPDRRLVVLVDQFEEVFTLCREETSRQAFVEALLYAGTVAGGVAIVILTLRADFVGRCSAHGGLAAALSDSQELVGPMTDDELRQAIEQPALRCGAEFDPGLVDMLLADVKAQPGGLPLLQHALLELWNAREGRRLTHRAYERIGRVEGALAKRADEVYTALDPAKRGIARRVLLRLTQPGEGTEDTRRRAAMAEVILSPAEGPAVEAVVRALADARLLVTEGDKAAQTVDVAHEALIRGWPALRQWIEEDRAGLREHRRLTAAAQEWQRLDRDGSALLRGLRLDQALDWRRRYEAELNEVERGFLDASVALREEQVAERQRDEAEKEAQRQRELEQARRLAEEAEARRQAETQRAQEAEARSQAQHRAKRVALGGMAVLFVVAAGMFYAAGGVNLLTRWAARRGLAGEVTWQRIPPAEIAPPASGKIQFQMGCVSEDKECYKWDGPRHPVELRRPFELMAHEVTVAQFRRFNDATGAPVVRWLKPWDVFEDSQLSWSADDHPAVTISWFEAAAFCAFVGGLLPTEAEWEYAARGGNADAIYPWGNKYSQDKANGGGTGGADQWGQTAPVGSFPPNGFGLHDMVGNVWEWTASVYRPYPYRGEKPGDPESREARVARGGSWDNGPWDLRVSVRLAFTPTNRNSGVGFRCARDVSP